MDSTRLVRCLTACIALSFGIASAHAQAVATARRANSLDVYAGAQLTQTDYNSYDKGFLVGGDFVHHLRLFDVGLDLRYNHAPDGAAVGEKTFLGGIKLSKGFGRYNPYGEFMYGYGVVVFDTPHLARNGNLIDYDDSNVKDLGGGVDIRLTRLFGVKADYHYQFWNLGVNEPLSPSIASVGIIFNIPYRYLRPRRY